VVFCGALVSEPRQTLVETGLATSTAISPHKSYICRVTAGPATGKQVAVGGRAVIVGTQAACDLVLDDPKVSRRHVQLQAAPEGIRIKDLESRNGTYADGVRVYDAVSPIATNATVSIRVGDTTLRVRAAPTPTIAPSRRQRFGALVGESLAMREVFAVLELAAPTDATVLLQGESGTGKELAARALHDHSSRAEGPFVVLDCGATHRELIESQLFGHVKGAFTGAVAERRGAFVEAGGGTLFLDEVGELPLESQAKLLRAIEARTVQPVGSDTTISVDTRVVAATHRDLGAMVDAGTYRFDLFHRLSVVHVAIPPLRERLEDLPVLVRTFYEGRKVDPGPIDGEPLARLQGHKWPGNVRELRNTLERSFVLQGAVHFSRLDLWVSQERSASLEMVDASLPFKEAKDRAIEAFERKYLAALMEKYGDNLTEASGHAGINRRHLKKLLEERGLRKE
jgi:DNA-binding NtrC family response regulator